MISIINWIGFFLDPAGFNRRPLTWLTSSEVPFHPEDPSPSTSGSATPQKVKDWDPKRLRLPTPKDRFKEEGSDEERLCDEREDKGKKNDAKKKKKGSDDDHDYEN